MTTLEELKDKTSITDQWIGKHSTEPWSGELNGLLSSQAMRAAQIEITQWDGYNPTELVELTAIAGSAGVGGLNYKDESTRFGLGSFKALGGAYAVMHYISQRLSEELGKEVSLAQVRDGAFAREASALTVATATDGNHGRSVAWGAKLAGCKCKIYIHAEVSKGREAAMAEFGAEVIRIKGDYDESVAIAASQARAHDWQVISDTSYDGYMDIPCQVMAGYTIMVREVLDQMETPPSHVIIQAGVGGLAAAVCAAFWTELGEKRPRFIVIESDRADCILASMKNGRPSSVTVEEETIMAGLSCGKVSLIAWEILSRGACAVITLPDDAVADAMRYMSGGGIEAGECAVPGIIALLAISKDTALKRKLGLDGNSSVLVFGCEGATDPELYGKILRGEA